MKRPGPAQGLRGVLVECSACEGSGKIKCLTRSFEFREVVCEICKGKGRISVIRKHCMQPRPSAEEPNVT